MAARQETLLPDVDFTADDLVLRRMLRPRRGRLATALAAALVLVVALGAVAATTLVVAPFKTGTSGDPAQASQELAQARRAAYDAGRKVGMTAGLSLGHANGVKVGLRTGRARGVRAGKNQGYRSGYMRGTRDAYQRGFNDAQKSYTAALTSFTNTTTDLKKQLDSARKAAQKPTAQPPTP